MTDDVQKHELLMMTDDVQKHHKRGIRPALQILPFRPKPLNDYYSCNNHNQASYRLKQFDGYKIYKYKLSLNRIDLKVIQVHLWIFRFQAKIKTEEDHAQGKPSSETLNKAKVKVKDALE